MSGLTWEDYYFHFLENEAENDPELAEELADEFFGR